MPYMAIKHKTDIKEIFKVLAECSFLKINNLLSKQTIRKRNLSYKPSNHLPYINYQPLFHPTKLSYLASRELQEAFTL